MSGPSTVDPRRCNLALQELSSSGERWSVLKQFYVEVRNAGLPLELETYRVLTLSAIEAHQGLDAVDLVRHCQEVFGPAPVPWYCSLVSRLLKRPGRGTPDKQAAYELWQMLRATRQRLDDVAYRTGMNLCVEMGHIAEARRLMDAMRAAGLSPGWGAYHILMKYHTERGEMDAARKLFAQLRAYRAGKPLEISAYNTLISGFVRQGDLMMARAVLDKARREGATPDAFTYSCYASGLSDAGRLDEAEALLGDMAAEGLLPSPVVYGAILDGCARLSDWSRADRLLARMRSDGLRPSLIHYNMLIRGRSYNSGYRPVGPFVGSEAANGSPVAVNDASAAAAAAATHGGHTGGDEGSARGVAQRHLSFSVAAAAGGDNGRNGNGISNPGGGGGGGDGHVEALMAEMRASGLRPDAVTYGTLIDAAVRSGSLDAALQVLAEMRVEGVPPDGTIFTSLMKLFREQGQQEQALEFFQQLVSSRSSAVDAWALSCLVAVYASSSRMDEAEQAADQAYRWAADHGAPPLPEAAYALLQGYGQQRQLHPALLAFRRFLASGGRPHRKMCEFLYRLCLSQFDFGAASQVLRAMRLMRGLRLREDLYRQLWEEADRRLQARSTPPGSPLPGNGPSGVSVVSAAAEKWKWWLGLPNNYYESDWRR